MYSFSHFLPSVTVQLPRSQCYVFTKLLYYKVIYYIPELFILHYLRINIFLLRIYLYILRTLLIYYTTVSVCECCYIYTMSLWKYFDGAGAKPPAPKRPKLDDEQKLATARAYETTKRERKWLSSWKTVDRGWLKYDDSKDEMHCAVCRSHASELFRKGPFVVGTGRFKLEYVKHHEASNEHKQCARTEAAKQALPGTSVADKALFSLNKTQTKRMRNLFLNAQAIAKQGRPFSDFTWQCA